MARFRHIIQKQVLDIKLTSETKAFDIQSEISRISKRSLNKIIKKILNDFSRKGEVIVIEQLTLDLGRIQLENLESGLTSRLRTQLKKQLRNQINIVKSKSESKQESKSISVKRQYTDALRYYFKKGVFPWWASRNQWQVSDLFGYLLKEQPRLLLALLQEFNHQPNALRRIVLQSTSIQKKELLKRLGQSKKAIFSSYHHILLKSGLQLAKLNVESTAWLITFSVALEWNDSGNKQDVFSVLSKVLDKHWEAKQYVPKLVSSVKKLAPTINGIAGIKSQILELAREKNIDLSQKGTFKIESFVLKAYINDYSNVDLLRYFLDKGTMPYWAKELSREDVKLWLKYEIKERNKSFIKTVLFKLKSPKMAARILGQFEEIGTEVINSLSASLKKWINDTLSELNQLSDSNLVSKLKQQTLKYLIANKGKRLNRVAFLKYHIEWLLQNVSSKAKTVDRARKSDHIDLAKVFAKTELEKLLNQSKTTVEEDTEDVQSGVDFLIFVFTKGYHPWWAEGRKVENALSVLLEQKRTEISAFLEQLLPNGIFRKRLAEQLDVKTSEQLLHSYLPDFSGLLLLPLSLVKGINLSGNLITEKFLWEILWKSLNHKKIRFGGALDASFLLEQFVVNLTEGLMVEQGVVLNLIKERAVKEIDQGNSAYFVIENSIEKLIKTTKRIEETKAKESLESQQNDMESSESQQKNKEPSESQQNNIKSPESQENNIESSESQQNNAEQYQDTDKEVLSGPLALKLKELQYFIEHGSLSENAERTGILTEKHLEQIFVKEMLIQAPRTVRALFKQIIQHRKGKLQIIKWLSIPSFQELITVLFPNRGERYNSLFNGVRVFFMYVFNSHPEDFEATKNAFLLVQFTNSGQELSVKEMNTAFLKLMEHQMSIQKGKVNEAFQQFLISEHAPESLKIMLKPDRKSKSKSSSPANIRELLKSRFAKEKLEEKVLKEPVYIQNAGLVLMWPFLSRYLSMLNLIVDQKFVSEEAQFRAVHLIQHLVTAKSESPEHHLPLNKLLCGIPISAPVPFGIEMTDEEIKLSEQVLKATIQNWEKIKSTSVSGFRQTFLIREGKLEERSENWVLKVEKGTFDMLLKTLPWGISMIKFPWMDKVLFVEWI